MPLDNKITFTGVLGDELAARLDMPPMAPRAYALFAHCFTCSKDIFAAARVSAGLAERGIAVLRFDFTGLGHSDGEFANTNFTSNVGDLVAAANWLAENYEAPGILIGHSLGGAAVLAAAGEIPGVKTVATIGAPFDPAHVSDNFSTAIAEINQQGEAAVSLGGRPFVIKKQFLDDIAAQDQKQRIKNLNKALLVFHAPGDAIVGIDNAAEIYGAAKHPKSFVSLDGADHLLSRKEDAVYVAEVIAAWAGRYLGTSEETTAAPEGEVGAVTVQESGEGKFTQVISAGGKHVLRADEPADYGGLDTGPTPYDLLLSGLGACTTMTIRMYADRKKIPLERASVTLRHDKIHGRDCAECETKDGKIDRITREIHLEGELSEEQRQSLLAIAEKCPVHRTLHAEVRVDSRLADR
ncbi:MAG: OsmC family protein [Rhodospirillaceae bacterium]|jgi:putative redox protein|nr:OsmC family protein [Rhodospirillaceae bacterium]MBT3886309.1 OsmC family protein [Rhodospirillaceae bacterium]MBT4116904.1 OsmC family protein [Rhodospirillaceae bacterium]MBT4670603.1 OsmC family protein [Rhodospirillaceae bacterium]MBT4721511.1 OsmC family protein [Rhodospirillaceae bacterium]